MILDSIRALLLESVAIRESVAERIYVGRASQGEALPLIILEHLDSDHMPVAEGLSGTERGTLQVECWAKSAHAAERLGEHTRLALNAAAQKIGNSDEESGYDQMLGVEIDTGLLDYDAPADGSDIARWRKLFRLTTWRAEQVA